MNWRTLRSVSLIVSLATIEYSVAQEQEKFGPTDSGYPYLAKDAIPEKARIAVSTDTAEDERFQAVWGLAISGYTEESARALTDVACDMSMGESTRNYAGMGLRNFTSQLPEESKRTIQRRLRAVLEEEGDETPNSIVRTLLAWGDASFVNTVFHEKLAGHAMEIEVLAALPEKEGSERLWQLYEACPKRRNSGDYNRRAEIGRALAGKNDVRGIDILVSLLPADRAPGGQYRHNVFHFLQRSLGDDFGYKALNYDPTLDEAVYKLTLWWEKNRDTFVLKAPDESLAFR